MRPAGPLKRRKKDMDEMASFFVLILFEIEYDMCL